MSERFKLTVWGGSGIATPELIDVLRQEMGDLSIDVVLLGRDEEKLKVVGEICRRMAEASGRDLRVSWTTDLDEAVEGADYVLNQIRVGGMKSRAFDETFPREFGIPGEETVGPGGFSNALRTIPVVLEYCRYLERVAPKAILLNLTNPSSFIQYAVTRYTKVSVIGVCDSPTVLMKDIARLLGLSYQECSFDYFGMHHFGWVTGVRWRGQDLMPKVLERVEELPKLEVEPELVCAVGVIPHPYMKYYLHPDRMLAKTEGRPPRAESLMGLEARILEAYRRWSSSEKPDVLTQRGAAWYREIIVPVLLSLMRDDGKVYVVNVVNGSLVSWLPPEAIIELPCMVTRQGAHPLAPAKIPQDIGAMIQVNCAHEMMAVEAMVEGSYAKALRALMLNLMVSNYGQAKGILDRIWPAAEGKKKLVTVKVYPRSKGKAEITLPGLVYGHHLLQQLPLEDGVFAVVTMEEPWVLAKERLQALPAAVVYIRDMDWNTVEAMERTLPKVKMVLGIGGGSAIDMAKYVGWIRKIPVHLVPSIASVDACVTKSVAVREWGNVRYIAFVVADKVWVDYDLIQSAPPRLNRAGVGDIISVHTALWDWALARDKLGEQYDKSIAKRARSWIGLLGEQTNAIRNLKEEGIRFIFEAYAAINLLCRQFGSSRPQEASEHLVAYSAERVTKRHFIHGELVALGTLAMSLLQENEPDRVRTLLDCTGVCYRPRDLGLSREELWQIMRDLPAQEAGRRYSVVNVRPITERFLQALEALLDF